uniref:Myosin-M heavy chain-like n=1 Tax=Phallusia mammillata TaxID=59560 RepID=A0A6F9DPX3_9ASCI|nr:myosin-M heavy chain-like [Phallusia mammillata]
MMKASSRSRVQQKQTLKETASLPPDFKCSHRRAGSVVSAFGWAQPINEEPVALDQSIYKGEDFCISPSPNESEESSDDDSDLREVVPIWHSRSFLGVVRMYNHRLSTNSSNFAREEAYPNAPAVVRESRTTKKPLGKTRSDSCAHSLASRATRDEKASYSLEDRATGRRRSETVINNFSQEHRSPVSKPRRTLRSENGDHEPIRPTARRAAVVSTLPDSDLTCLSDTIASMQRNQPVLSAEMKRSRWNFLNFKSKDKDRSGNLKLEEVLHRWKTKDEDLTLVSTLRELTSCKGENRWHRNGSHTTKHSSISAPFHSSTSTRERKRQDAVWELFTSERTYLIDHLLVLQQVFMEPLQELQCDGYLLAVDVRSVFGNLEEVCKVSLDFCRALLNVVEDKTSHHFGCANSIETAFESFGSVLCPPYQRYCTSYTNSITYREELKQNEDFGVFLKWCERNPKCQRLKLNDFLVSPMQHLTKYPLLLRHIAEYTSDKSQNALIETTLLAVQESLKALDGKVSWLTHFQFLQDLQSSISWPPVYELDTKTTLPEPLRHALSIQPCRNLIANPKRQLILDGSLSIVENGRSIEIYALLFDDMMVFTRPRKGKRKASEIPSSLKRHPVLKDGTLLMVHRQPVALDRFMVYDVETEHASSLGVKNAFLVVQENRFQQMTTITMLQASSEDLKRKWLTRLASTAAQWMEKHIYAATSISSPCINRKPDENGLSDQELLNIGTRSRLARQKSVEPSDDLSNETFSVTSDSKSPWLELNGCFIDP